MNRFAYKLENYKEDIIKLVQRIISRLVSGNQSLLQRYETIFLPD